jgi:signal peptidase I
MNTGKVKQFIRRTWKEWWKTLAIVVFVIIPLKSSVADWNWVPSGSMNPTILEGDLVYVNKLAYDLRFPLTFHRLAKWAKPERGNIVICFSPEDKTRLVKRVVGLPGDTIEMKANVLYINGKALTYSKTETDYAGRLQAALRKNSVFATEDLEGFKHTVMSVPSLPATKRSFSPITVPQDSFFVMGDNRDMSRDSRFFGFVKSNAIIGRATRIIVSFDKTEWYQPRLSRTLTPLK